MPTTPTSDRRLRLRPARRTPTSRRLLLGLAAGLAGGAAVDLAGRGAELAGRPRRPTLPAQLVAKSVRLPADSHRLEGPVQHTAAMVTGMQDAVGSDPQRIERVGQLAHYTWSAAWGGVRGLLDLPRFSRFSAALIHGVGFAATDHLLLAAANVGAPIYGRHDDPTDAAVQAGQLLLYALTSSLTYQQLASSKARAPGAPRRSR